MPVTRHSSYFGHFKYTQDKGPLAHLKYALNTPRTKGPLGHFKYTQNKGPLPHFKYTQKGGLWLRASG